MKERPGRTIIAIDLLRFACALLVLAYHFGTIFAHGASPHLAGAPEIATLPVAWRQASWFGWIGVDLFFVISGCVIAGSAEGARTGDFLWRRARRLLPGAVACATVTFCLLAAIGLPLSPLAIEWMRSVLFVPVGPWIDPSYWTLGIELAFYLLVAALLLVPGGSTRLEWLGWCLAIFSLAFWITLLGQVLPASLGIARVPQLLLLTHGSCFALGIFARAVLSRGGSSLRTAGIVLALAGTALEIAAKSVGEANAFGIAAGLWLPGAIFIAGLAVVFGANRLQSLLERLPSGWTAAAGLATYPLYLLHQDAGGAAFVLLQRAGVAPIPAIMLVVVLLLAASFAIALWVEPLFRRAMTAAARISRFRGPAPDTRRSASLPTG